MWGFLSKEIFDKSTFVNEYTNVWSADAYQVLFYEIKKHKKIILGGDIYTDEMEPTCDSWYFNIIKDKNREENCSLSYEKAIDYITNYISLNGMNFYIDVVIK